MSKIVINTDGLRQNTLNLSKRFEELQQLNNQLESTLNTIESEWEGGAARSYVSMMRKYIEQGRKMEQVLYEIKSYAEKTATEFTSADQVCAGKINSSF